MIHNPYSLILVLIAVEAGILYLGGHERTKFLFSFLPSMFWIYFLPMLLSTFGVIDGKSPVYAQITKLFLPPALFLLLLKVDIKAISRLGPTALIMFFSGSLGIVLGIILTFVVFKSWVGPQFWGGFSALSASWTGGSANMIAVKEALNVPDAVFMPMVIVDTIVPYAWVGILVALAARQKSFDAWNNADRSILDDLARRTEQYSGKAQGKIDWKKAVLMIGLAFLIGRMVQAVAVYLPMGKNILTPYAWAIILVTTIAIIFSNTPLSRIQQTGSHQWGKWILYFVLTSIGARASLTNAPQAGILILAGVCVLIVHICVMLMVARLIRAPLFLVATASLSNIAGLVSAPVIAEVYQPGLASVGLLLAILGHSLGAYIGIATGQILHLISGHST